MIRVLENAYPPLLRQERHAHETTTVSLVLAGALRESVGAAEEIAQPLSVVVKPRGTEHADQFGGQGARMIQIVLDEELTGTIERWERGMERWRWSHAGPATPAFLRLLRAKRGAREQEDGETRVENAALDVLAALASEGGGTERQGAPPRWIASVRERLDDGAALAVRSLASSAGVHPVYLARCFRQWYGCSITAYAARRRVQRAAGRVASTSRPLSAVSCDLGFADQPHMCRIFRRHTGLAPSEYRALAAVRG
jgi:AraC family transcriptional regulator